MKSLYDNLKQKQGEGSKAGEFNASKGWFGFTNTKITEKEASANQEAADKFPNATKKITEEKGSLPEQIFNGDESTPFWKVKKKKRCKGHLLVRKKREHQDLRQEGIN